MRFLAVQFNHARDDLEVWAELCLRFTSQVVVRAPDTLLLEWERGRNLTSLEGLKKRIEVLFRRRDGSAPGTHYRFAEAATIPEAVVAVRTQAPPEEAPIESIRDWIDPLAEHPEWVSAIAKMAEALFWLGVRKVGQVRRLERAGFIARFGSLGATLLQNLENPADFPFSFFRPTEKWVERKEFWDVSGAEDLSFLLFEIKGLVDRLLPRVFSRGRAITRLRIALEKERAGMREVYLELPIGFTFPQGNAKAILKLAHEKLEQALGKRAEENFTVTAAIEVAVLETLPRREAQTGFLQDAEERAEKFSEFVSELSVKLAERKNFFMVELVESHRPEAAWERVVKLPSRVANVRPLTPPRPIRFIDPPERMHRLGRYLIWRGERFRIHRLSQIEKIRTEWWQGDGGVHRTYFRIDTAPAREAPEAASNTAGLALWVYRDRGGEEALFVQGIF